jgi:hypothetical protein
MGGTCGTCGVEERFIQGICWGDLKERDHLEDPGVDVKIILKWILMKRNGAWTGLIWLRIGTGDSSRRMR